MRRYIPGIVLLLLLQFLLVQAAPPSLPSIYPAGGGRGETVTVTTGGTYPRWPVQAWIEGKGVEIRPGKAKGTWAISIAADAAPGPRWLRLFDGDGGSLVRPFVVGTLPEVAEKEPNDDYRKPQVLPTSSLTVNGRLQKAGDVDCFAVNLRKGQTLVASLDASRTLASPMDGVLQVVSERGFVLAQNNDHRGLDPQVAFAVPEDGSYIVRVFAFPSVPNSSIGFAGGDRFFYRLTLTTGAWAEYALPLAVERSRPGSVELFGWNIPASGRSHAVVVKPGEDRFRPLSRELSGPAVVRVEDHPCIRHTRPGDLEKPQALTAPVSVTGLFERSGEVHAYQFRATKGQRFVVQVEAPSLGSTLDPIVQVIPPKGRTLSPARSRTLHQDVSLNVAATVPGDYRIEIRDQYGNAGPGLFYLMRVLVAQPDFALRVPSDQIAVKPGTPADVIVTIDRQNGFKDEVTLTVEGLPTGVRAEVLPAKGATQTVRLQANAKTAAMGPVRIVGRAGGTGGPTRFAVAPLAEYGATISDLWLTVSPTAAVSTAAPKKKKR